MPSSAVTAGKGGFLMVRAGRALSIRLYALSPLANARKDMVKSVNMSAKTPQELAIHHIVHEYANFVSSAEMVIHGKDIEGVFFKPPLNTHVSHAFYLNCRKLADFFQNKSIGADDVVASHFVSGYIVSLADSDKWRKPIDKQLAHITYSRDTKPKEIKTEACLALYKDTSVRLTEHHRLVSTMAAVG